LHGLVDIKERLVHLLVFYYNMVKIVTFQFEVDYIYQILYMFVYLNIQNFPHTIHPVLRKGKKKTALSSSLLYVSNHQISRSML
jgi:hypothetical protein